MKVDVDPRLPSVTGADAYQSNLNRRLYQLFRQISQQVNGLSEGQMVANYSASTTAPTTGTYNQGDFIRNSTPSELGSAGSKYVVFGFVCVVSGTPGTWVQQRFLTGN
jgi:hypothetical protein